MQSFKSDELPENPRQHANLLSSVMFCFTMPTFFKGRKQVLNESDLYRALKEHKSDMIGGKLSEAWAEQCRKTAGTKSQPSLFKAVFKAFGFYYMLLGVLLLFIEIGFRCMQPIFLGQLVKFYSNTETSKNDETEAYLYAMGVILCTVFNVLLLHPNSLGIQHSGMKIRVALCSLIYRKALRLSKSALGDTTSGQIVNLMSNDVGRLDTSMLHLHYLWIGPIALAVVTYLMYLEIGIAAFFGVILMLLFIPIQGVLGKKTSKYRLLTALSTDERVRMMNEIITGIQVIKMYAWEYPFGKIVEHIRRKEMKAIRYANYIRGLFSSFIMFLTRISVFTSLLAFVLLGNFLTAEKAFVVTAFLNVLKNHMTVFFPLGVGQFAETLVSFRRLQAFMLLEETTLVHKNIDCFARNLMSTAVVVSENGKKQSLLATATKEEKGLVITNLKAKWNTKSLEYTLNDINLNIKAKTLVAVIGPVGSGKSSLIQAILGELPPAGGNLKVTGAVSYASQEPWLFTGTVRQNILFGSPMDKKRYNMTVQKCALMRDFELLPFGDKTIVGERGASLSGGQKARINLARAVYREADIYLLDDPLSAVDTHVGRHLFDECMKDYLREHIVILVTHQLQFLEHADLIVIMNGGRVSAVGKYDNMLQSGLDFAQLLSPAELKEEDGMSLNGFKRRKTSESSTNSIVESIAQSDAPQQVEESREEGKIGWQLYKKYFGSSGGVGVLLLLVVSCLGCQVLASGSDYFLSYWVNQNENSLVEVTRSDVQSKPVDIYIFTVLNVAVIVLAIFRSFLFFNLAMKSSTSLHNAMYLGVTRATMYFFNTNPSGRILNRFSKDMGQVDEILPSVMMDVIQIFLALFGILVVLCTINPWYLLVTAVLIIIFYYLRSFYLKTSRDIKRLEATTRSPIYTHMAASLNGLATIRAFDAQHVLISEFDNFQDLHSAAFYMFLATSRAFGYWLDCCCVVYIALITLSFFVFSPENSGKVGLAITQALGMTGMVQWGMRQSAELENTMTSVERVVEYETIESEGALESQQNKKPPKSWPANGQIEFNNLSLRYSPDPKSDYVLKFLNFMIYPGEKVGIVGRTGAGKSSLINALFRLSYNDGAVLIDERDTSELGLHDLRNNISIIPQEPVLFSGTMRYNLDPFDEYDDSKLWEALAEVKLKQVLSDMPHGLLSQISEGGTNFSVGQRQLVCLARAVLRENRILVLDEATANVDPQTDALIQTTIRSKFKNCTVLTIAHRLHTVMDSDKVLVMDAGRAVEFASPYKLLTDLKFNVFHSMVKQTGHSNFETLLKVAQNAYERNSLAKKET